MKKVLTTIVCVALTLCIAMFAVGCGSDTFSGNYTETTVADVNSFATEIPATGSDMQLSDGVKMEIVMNSVTGSYYQKTNMSLNAIEVDGALKMSGSATVDMNTPYGSGKSSGKIYYDTDTMYMSEGNVKQYMQMPIENYLGQYTADFIGSLDVALAEFSGEVDGVKFFMERGETSNKVKIEVDTDYMKGAMYFVYDTDNNLTAVKMEVTMTQLTTSIELKVSMEAWNGTITLPGDLDTYTPAY